MRNFNRQISVSEKNIEASNTSYAYILERSGLVFETSGNFLMIGENPNADDRYIYMSIIISQIPYVLEVIVPQLSAEGLTFKVARNKEIASEVLNGYFGYNNIGKIMKVYVSREQDFNLVIKKLISYTLSLNGPPIPGFLNIGGAIYIEPNGKKNSVSTENSYVTKIYNKKYLCISVIKPDVKGAVLIGLYFKFFLCIKRLIIKEGKQFMWSDEGGRDMKKRLEWQFKIHNDLHGKINIAKPIDFFEQSGNAYFAMEYIDGVPISNFIDNIYNGRCWVTLTNYDRGKVIDILLIIIDMLEVLHQNGYIHRDLTPANFLITKQNKIYMIDLEMTYGKAEAYPYPVFQYGTTGFVSPEQLKGDVPTEKEDIYALGALMIFFFTDMPPVKFDTTNLDELSKGLFVFTRNKILTKCICRCLERESDLRPTLKEIKDIVISVLKRQPEIIESIGGEDYLINPLDLNKLIRNAISGIITPRSTQNNGLLLIPGKVDLRVSNKNSVTGIPSFGLKSPITGIILVLYFAGDQNYDRSTVELLKTYLNNYVDLIRVKKEADNPGLFFGDAGKAIAIHFASLLGIIPQDIHNNLVRSCFEKSSMALNISEGLAGQLCGLLLINSQSEQSSIYTDLLNQYAAKLIGLQEKNGSWLVHTTNHGKKHIPIGLEDGVGGILFSLIKFDQIFPSDQCKDVIKKGLLWLLHHIDLSNNSQNSTFENMSLFRGTAGIALVFLYAYEHLQNKEYKDFAERILLRFPHPLISSDYRLSTGIAGLGLVYSEAARICESNDWLVRTGWIYSVINNTAHKSSKHQVRWVVNAVEDSDQSLFTGNTGVIFFLLMLKSVVI